MDSSRKTGSLLVIGGSEDRTGPKEVLQRFIDLAGGPTQPIVVLTAASEVPDDVWKLYRNAFDGLEVANVKHIDTATHADAEKDANAEAVRKARGIFMTGGAQERLLDILGDSAMLRAMREAFDEGACIAGTSAGASALCTQMLLSGKAELLPEKGAINLGGGLGFIEGVIVDQHFSQRHRINRLLTVTAEHPDQFGIGIDEDTALAVQPGVGIEVVGEGSVNIVDCRKANTNINEIPEGGTPRMLGVCLHVLPSGTAFHLQVTKGAPSLLARNAAPAPCELSDLITTLTNRTTSE